MSVPRDDDDWDDDDDVETVPCPYCRRAMPEDAPRCPYCENYISEEDAPPGRKPTWIVVGAVLCLLMALLWALGG
jgi:hypothetical protein